MHVPLIIESLDFRGSWVAGFELHQGAAGTRLIPEAETTCIRVYRSIVIVLLKNGEGTCTLYSLEGSLVLLSFILTN